MFTIGIFPGKSHYFTLFISSLIRSCLIACSLTFLTSERENVFPGQQISICDLPISKLIILILQTQITKLKGLRIHTCYFATVFFPLELHQVSA